MCLRTLFGECESESLPINPLQHSSLSSTTATALAAVTSVEDRPFHDKRPAGNENLAKVSPCPFHCLDSKTGKLSLCSRDTGISEPEKGILVLEGQVLYCAHDKCFLQKYLKQPDKVKVIDFGNL